MTIKLDELITTDEKRDAVHVAIFPATAGDVLYPGQWVRLDGDTAYSVGSKEEGVGVVSIFLVDPIEQGERFWVMLYPNTVTGMRHHWEHPRITTNQEDEIEFSNFPIGSVDTKVEDSTFLTPVEDNDFDDYTSIDDGDYCGYYSCYGEEEEEPCEYCLTNDPEGDLKRIIEDAGRTVAGYDYEYMMCILDCAYDDEYYCTNMGENERYKNVDFKSVWDAYFKITGKQPRDRHTPFTCLC